MGAIGLKAHRICILLIVLPALVLAGQVDSLKTSERSLPYLNNHYFIPNSNFLSPFINTYFKTGIGGGVSLNTIPIYDNNGDKLLGTLEGENTYVTADIHVQVEANSWLAVWFRYQVNARIGSSTPTLLAHGVSSFSSFEFGWMPRLWQNKKNLLTGTISINNSSVSAMNVAGFLKDVIANPDSVSTALRKSRNLLDGGAGLRYAYSFNDVIGIQAYANALYGESFVKENRNVWKFDLGFLGSFNFIQSHNIPVGFNLGYSIQKFSLFEDHEEENIHSIMFKLAYTGREEYSIGLEFTNIRTIAPMIKSENTLEYLETTFVMVYYF